MKIKKYKQFNESHSSTRTHFDIIVPNDITLIKNVFKKHNYDVFLVGGCVRDSLLNVTPKDWDLVTDALPDKVIEILRNEKFVKSILETGKQFGVINVITDTDEFEIATFRKDSISSDSRHPDSVEFTDMETDANRRDLSINALYYDLDTNEIIDFVGGIDDIKNGVIRTVGNPDDRFSDDKLRRLRSVRFAARFGTRIDKETDESLTRDSSLEGISVERIRDEFLKGIKSAKSVIYFLELLNRYDLFKWILKSDVNKDFVEERDPYVLISYLLSWYKKSHTDTTSLFRKLESLLHSLTYSVDEIRKISFLSKLPLLSLSNVFILKKSQSLSGVTDEQIRKIGELFKLDSVLIDSFIQFKLSVNGDDMIKRGLKGKEIGDEIERLEIENFKKIYTK